MQYFIYCVVNIIRAAKHMPSREENPGVNTVTAFS